MMYIPRILYWHADKCLKFMNNREKKIGSKGIFFFRILFFLQLLNSHRCFFRCLFLDVQQANDRFYLQSSQDLFIAANNLLVSWDYFLSFWDLGIQRSHFSFLFFLQQIFILDSLHYLIHLWTIPLNFLFCSFA